MFSNSQTRFIRMSVERRAVPIKPPLLVRRATVNCFPASLTITASNVACTNQQVALIRFGKRRVDQIAIQPKMVTRIESTPTPRHATSRSAAFVRRRGHFWRKRGQGRVGHEQSRSKDSSGRSSGSISPPVDFHLTRAAFDQTPDSTQGALASDPAAPWRTSTAVSQDQQNRLAAAACRDQSMTPGCCGTSAAPKLS